MAGFQTDWISGPSVAQQNSLTNSFWNSKIRSFDSIANNNSSSNNSNQSSTPSWDQQRNAAREDASWTTEQNWNDFVRKGAQSQSWRDHEFSLRQQATEAAANRARNAQKADASKAWASALR
jgi:hypothetical protein